MEGLPRERFLKIYANLPLTLREETILLLEDGGIKKPLSWNVAYLEVKENTDFGTRILKELDELKLI
jgi:hypothetical protein